MPANRLPWVRVWIEALDHEKFAALTDSDRWTWVALLAKASQQPKRWRFASVKHAAQVTGRPATQIRHLIAVRLVDELEDGIAIHDAKQWQEAASMSPTTRGSRFMGERTVTEEWRNGDESVSEEWQHGDKGVVLE